MKIYLSLLVLLTIQVYSFGQIQTEIQSEKIYDLSVLQVYPDSFPEIEVLFLARDQTNRPLWGITEKDITVLEDDNSCEIIDLENISKSEVINIAVVFDHSGSMGYPKIPDSMYSYEWSPKEIDSLMLLPKAIDYAKDGVLSFISSNELKSDSILLAGFSSYRDSIVGPTQDTSILQAKVNSMYADYGTAYYDALLETLTYLSKRNNQKSAIVSLTDGYDNESKGSVTDVINLSNELNIPIYVIGLGNVQDSILSAICDSTDGLYYRTDDPSKLNDIYLNISRQLKSVYKLTYASKIKGFTNSEHSLSFGFTNDTLSFSNPDIRLTLPEEVIDYLRKQEQLRIEAQRNKNILIGGFAAGISVIGLTSFVLYRRRKQNSLKMNKLYPNPFNEELNINLENNIQEEIDIQIFDTNGQEVFKTKTLMKENQLQLSHLPRGAYIVKVTAKDGTSQTEKVMKK